MARTKGMLNLSGNLEVNAQAPLDARTIVPTEADLTVASNFPYPYVGLEVYVTGTGKKFRLTNLDTTQSSSWHEIGEGGGGSGLPSGGTQGQYLVKQSSTEGDADWQTLSAFGGATSQSAGSAGLVPAPSAGDEGKVLFGNGAWGNIVMPSVDYSQQSDEASILSTTEKAIGQWTNGKLLYQKTIDCGAMPSTSGNKNVSISSLGIDELVGIKAYAVHTTDYYLVKNIPYSYSSNDLVVWGNRDNLTFSCRNLSHDDWNGYATIQYTKASESALPADEKFAGVTSSGAIIYKRTWMLNTPLPGSGDNPKYVNIQLTGLSSIPIDLLLKHDIAVKGVGEDNAGKYLDGNSTKLTSTIFPTNSVAEVFQTQTSVTGGFVVKEITLYYTKSS